MKNQNKLKIKFKQKEKKTHAKSAFRIPHNLWSGDNDSESTESIVQ